MILLLVGATVVWLAVCLFVVALCMVAKQADAGTMMSSESAAAERSAPGIARQVQPAAASSLRLI